MNWTEKINRTYEKLEDEESRFIFDQRISYLVNGDVIRLWNNIKRNKNWICPNKNNDFIIFGAGMLGKLCLDILQTAGKNVLAFCDNYKHGEVWGKSIITVEQAVQYEKPIVIPWGSYTKEAQKQLLGYGIDKKYILQEPDIRSYTGVQYFDVW